MLSMADDFDRRLTRENVKAVESVLRRFMQLLPFLLLSSYVVRRQQQQQSQADGRRQQQQRLPPFVGTLRGSSALASLSLSLAVCCFLSSSSSSSSPASAAAASTSSRPASVARSPLPPPPPDPDRALFLFLRRRRLSVEVVQAEDSQDDLLRPQPASTERREEGRSSSSSAVGCFQVASFVAEWPLLVACLDCRLRRRPPPAPQPPPRLPRATPAAAAAAKRGFSYGGPESKAERVSKPDHRGRLPGPPPVDETRRCPD